MDFERDWNRRCRRETQMGEGRTVPVSGSGGLVSDGPRLSGTLRPSAGRGKVARTVPVSGWRISTLQGGGSARRFALPPFLLLIPLTEWPWDGRVGIMPCGGEHSGRPVRKKLSHEIPPWVDERCFHFISICCLPRWKNQLCRPDTGAGLLETVGYYHAHFRWYCRLFLLMPDHLHGIICFPKDQGLRPLVKSWKSYAARHWQIQWQSDFFDHRLRDRFQLEEKLSYVLNNPVRAGLCADVESWP